MDDNVAFVDLPAGAFPFQIQVIDDELGVVWEANVDGPGALRVPGFGPERASHRTVRITHGADDGTAESL